MGVNRNAKASRWSAGISSYPGGLGSCLGRNNKAVWN